VAIIMQLQRRTMPPSVLPKLQPVAGITLEISPFQEEDFDLDDLLN